MAFDLTSNEKSRAAPQMSHAVYLFLSAFTAVSGEIAQISDQKRRLSCAGTLRVRGDDPEADIAAKFIRDAEADLAASERRLGYGPSVWEQLERLPTYREDRRHRSLYRAFVHLIADDFSWFAAAAAAFYEADVPVAPVGCQVVTGVEEIASATRRTPAGVLRLIQGDKLPVYTVDGEPTSTHAMLRPHRRYGVSAIAA
jgi:hypothetical protein